MPADPIRDRKIADLFAAGYDTVALAERFSLNRSRVLKILNQQGNEKIKAILSEHGQRGKAGK
jgi:hypothetical protein